MKKAIHTDKAPPSIGTYSQAIKIGNTVYLSGQIPVDPATKELVTGGIVAQANRVFENLKIVIEEAGGTMDSVVRVGVYLTDLTDFPTVNDTMLKFFKQPYPARTTIGVTALPKGSLVEVDALMVV